MSPRSRNFLIIAAIIAIVLWQSGKAFFAERERRILREHNMDPAFYTLKPPPGYDDPRQLTRIPILAVTENDLDGKASKTLGLESYQQVSDVDTWSNALAAEDPPIDAFHAYYLTTDTPGWGKSEPLAKYFASLWSPGRLIAVDKEVFAIDVHARNEFQGIPAQDFAACWLGKIAISESAMYEIVSDASQAEVRILLDHHMLIHSSRPKGIALVYLDPGIYTLEVEYRNHSAAIDFSVKFQQQSSP